MAALQLLFAATFFVCRILIGPFLTYCTLVSPSTTALVKVGGFSNFDLGHRCTVFGVSPHQAVMAAFRLEQRASRLSASSGSTGLCR